jgi:hypothetical protein
VLITKASQCITRTPHLKPAAAIRNRLCWQRQASNSSVPQKRSLAGSRKGNIQASVQSHPAALCERWECRGCGSPRGDMGGDGPTGWLSLECCSPARSRIRWSGHCSLCLPCSCSCRVVAVVADDSYLAPVCPHKQSRPCPALTAA